MTTTDHTTQTHAVNKLLPFPTELYTDMGGDDWHAPACWLGIFSSSQPEAAERPTFARSRALVSSLLRERIQELHPCGVAGHSPQPVASAA